MFLLDRASSLRATRVVLFATILWIGAASLHAAMPMVDLPQPIRFRGSQIVLDGFAASDLEAGTVLRFKVKQRDRSYASFTTETDDQGRFTIALDAAGLLGHDSIVVSIERNGGHWIKRVPTIRESSESPSNAVPARPSLNADPAICTTCGSGTCGTFSPEIFAASNEAREGAVQLVDGTVLTRVPVLSFPSRLLGFELVLHHQSLTTYRGPVGESWSHTYNLFVVQVGEAEAWLVTPDLRVFPFFRQGGGTTVGGVWSPPEGFFGTVERNEKLQRWVFTHATGARFELLLGSRGLPGPLVRIAEPNGNRTLARLDASGFLAKVVTDLGQEVVFRYTDGGKLLSLTDPIERTWGFGYDAQGNLAGIHPPPTDAVDIGPGREITDRDLPQVFLTNCIRTTRFKYDDPKWPHQISRIVDPRGAVPVAYTYVAQGPDAGRVAVERRNGRDITFTYGPAADSAPQPLPLLDLGNTVTRIVDREGNVTDYEMHGPGGGPIGGKGAFGLRRRVGWTERGEGNPPLRPDEPDYREQRWLHDCNCLSPIQVSQPFDADAGLSFDNQKMPVDYPTEIFEYNDRRQVTAYELRGGTGESIRWQKTYDTFERFSRMLTGTEPRGFDDNPLHAGLDFTHTYAYDGAGNLTTHRAPTVRRGTTGEQTIEEIWTYNASGQVLTHRDPNGNFTVNTYFNGQAAGGDINTRGDFGGYLASTTRGATGSADPAVNLTTRFRVNALGMVTERTDPNGFVYGTEYNNLGEITRLTEPEVTLANGTKAQYETLFLFDGAGNPVVKRRRNVDFDGTANDFVDQTASFDAVGNVLSTRIEVDDDDAHDLVTRYAYDANDQQIVIQKPEGNRTFVIYDERRLPSKTFYGIAPGGAPAASYPADKRAEHLEGTAFVGFTATTYDARDNAVELVDGRRNITRRFYDFADRRIAERDPNGNGRAHGFDDASNVILEQAGAISATGAPAELLERTYHRFDEAGRQYQTVRDIDLTSDESAAVDPDDGRSSSHRTAFDPSGRVVQRTDAEANPTFFSFDAADRTTEERDALGSRRRFFYDANSKLVRLEEIEVPDPEATVAELYVTTFELDQVNRRVAIHVLGLDESIDHLTSFAYDSRNNLRQAIDAEGNVALSTFDLHDRLILFQRFAGRDGTELVHHEHAYDRNDNKAQDIARADVTDPASAEATRYAYDNLDRRVRTIYPDSDDPIDGSGDGTDGKYDRIEVAYDANSNAVSTRDPRRVVVAGVFDPGNRLAWQLVNPPADLSLPGERTRRFIYDALNRVRRARNDYSLTVRNYDPLSRLISETQRLRLDGTGFGRGYESPIRLDFTYDRQGNRLSLQVGQDLEVVSTYDELNRVESLQARHFANAELRPIANYEYFGPSRVTRKTLGNGAELVESYDPKRRISRHEWTATENGETLVGFEYDYDLVDNALFERYLHDEERYDNYGYNPRYELTGVTFRAAAPVDYRSFGGSFSDTFTYDDIFNRTEASFGDPLDRQPNTIDSYTANLANEYTEIVRNNAVFAPVHDEAGNMTSFPVRPLIGPAAKRDVLADAHYDAFNQLTDIQAGENPRQHYRYDAFGRLTATLELSATTAGTAILPGSRRFVLDGWSEVVEHLFNEGATLAQAPSRLERVYVQGPRIDELLLTAVDGDGDRRLEDKNTPGGVDFEYYALDNRMGSVTALLDADVADRILESYRYSAYGEPAVLEPFVPGPVSTQTLSPEVNPFLFTGRRLEGDAGLYYYRMRYMDATSGRFVQRDKIFLYAQAPSYGYSENRPIYALDPFGLHPSVPSGPVGKPAEPPPISGDKYDPPIVIAPGGTGPPVPEKPVKPIPPKAIQIDPVCLLPTGNNVIPVAHLELPRSTLPNTGVAFECNLGCSTVYNECTQKIKLKPLDNKYKRRPPQILFVDTKTASAALWEPEEYDTFSYLVELAQCTEAYNECTSGC